MGLCNTMLHLPFMALQIMRYNIIYDLHELVEFYIFGQQVDIEYHFNVMLFCSFIFSSRIMCPILLGLEVFRSCRMENLFFKYISRSLPKA